MPSGRPHSTAGTSDGRRAPGAGARRVRRVVTGAALAVLVAAVAAVLIITVLVTRAPRWWRVRNIDEGVVAAGTGLENGVVNEMSRVRPGGGAPWRSEEWSVEISADDATAWLNTRLRKWLASRGVELPDSVGRMQVDFVEGEARLGVEVGTGGQARVLSAGLRPFIGADGGLWTRPARVYAGLVPVPESWIGEEAASGSDSGAVVRAMAGGRALAERPVVTLGDGRVVRVVRVEVHEGTARITCRTEAGGGPR